MGEPELSWTSKRVLVTGAGGFIGSHLTERLVELGAETRGLVHYNSLGRWGWLDHSPVRSQIEVIAGDIADPNSVKQATDGVEIVFHLAALIGIPHSYAAPLSYVRANVEGTLNVLQAALELGVERVVHTSTSEAYGTAQYVPIDERHPLQGQSPYSATKIAADKLAEAFHCSFGLPVVTLRPFNTYGPRQSDRAVIPTVISQCLGGNIVRLGNLTPTRDFNYVADTVDGFVLAAQAQEAVGQVINLGTGEEISIADLAHKIASLMGKRIEIQCEQQRVRPKESEVDRLCAANELARNLLDWAPSLSLDEGLRLTIEWSRRHRDTYRPQVYSI